MPSSLRLAYRWDAASVTGPVVVIDVVRAFTSAAYAFAAGAEAIHLVATVEEALALKAAHPGWLAMGEDGGRRVPGFDLSNSPVETSMTDLRGRTVVQRTSAGTNGVVAATAATRLWCASLVCASATAKAVAASGLGLPTYVITGRFEDRPDLGDEDVAAAELIEDRRLGLPGEVEAAVRRVRTSPDAIHTLTLGPGNVHPEDVDYATDVDRFDFAMEVERVGGLLRLRATPPPLGS